MTDDGARLSAERRESIREVFGRAGYQALFDAARERFERAGDAAVRSVLLRALNPEERQAIAELHGWERVPEENVRIDLARLDDALRASRAAAGLEDVLEALGGPLVDRRAQREAAGRERERMWQMAREHAAVTARPELLRWLDHLQRTGALKRAARADRVAEADMLGVALAVVARLPSEEGLPLSVLATETTGDAHSLDSGRPLAGLVLRGIACLCESAEQRGPDSLPPDATGRRALWAEAGVHCDALSCHVLVLGLKPEGDERLARHMRESADDGEPRRITLRELAPARLRFPADTGVFVCENPAVVAVAADRLKDGCAPLVCVEGVPSAAAWLLLNALRVNKADIRFHADFDWGGIRIGNLLVQRLGAEPWRFDHREYTAAVDDGPPENPLEGVATDALWDPELAPAMAAARRAVNEELVIEKLLDDLAAVRGR